ncbi:MAG: hypothetical protein RL661_1666 [Pseudomonadota bacterium]
MDENVPQCPPLGGLKMAYPKVSRAFLGYLPGSGRSVRSGFLFGLLLLGACEGPQRVRISPPFNPAAARKMLEPGTNQIVGTALMWLSSGGVLSCAGDSATLYPATPYAREWARLTYETLEPTNARPQGFYYRSKEDGPSNLAVDSHFLETGRTVACNGDGHFTFDQVADGEFYLVARLVWQHHIWDEYGFFYGKQYHSREGTVMKKIRIQGGQKVTASLKWSVPNSRYDLW